MVAQKRVNEHFPNQDFGFIEDEIWKPVVVHGVTVDSYRVSNYGNVIGPQNKKLKWTPRSKAAPYPRVSIYFNPSLLEPAGYTFKKCKDTDVSKAEVNVHVLVANAFLPINDNIPEELNEYIEIDGQPKHLWSLLPDHTKLWLRSLLNVDHIDNDKSNPHVSNLTFVTPRENNTYVKKQKLEGSC